MGFGRYETGGKTGGKREKRRTTGLRSASKLRLALSSSFLESALRKNVVWRDFWFVDASSRTLYCAWTCLMTSPRDVGLPSLPTVDGSIEGRTNVSETRGCLDAAGLMRGPAFAAHAEATGLLPAWAAGARDGKASWDSVSTLWLPLPLDAVARALTGVSSTRLGNGSGAPSSSCLFWDGGEYAAVAAGKRQVRYLEVSSREGHGGG